MMPLPVRSIEMDEKGLESDCLYCEDNSEKKSILQIELN